MEDWEYDIPEQLDDPDDIPGETPEVESGLSNADYNLDSPLNPDFVEGLRDYLLTGSSPVHHFTQIQRERIVIGDHINFPLNELRDHSAFHPFAGQLFKILANPIGNPPPGIDDLLKDTAEKLWMSKLYLNTFKTRLGINANNSSRSFDGLESANAKYSKNYLIGYIQLHVIILVMNGSRDILVIRRQAQASRWSELGMDMLENENLVIFRSTILGDVKVFHQSILLMDYKLLLDKNMVLMLKDVCVGRFMTINILESSKSKILHVMMAIFSNGDDLLMKYGNMSYDSIKLLEPMSVHRWLIQSSRSQYDYDSADKFRNHLKHASNALGEPGKEFFENIVKCLDDLADPEEVGVIFGSFRLWGHPFIDYKEGLRKLKDQCRLAKTIDRSYSMLLADDLTFLIVKDHYRRTGQWAITKNSSPDFLKPYIEENRWPSEKILQENSVRWSKLQKEKIYEVPSDIPLSQIYSDKSFSMTRSELSNYLNHSNSSRNPIPSRRVLEELLQRPTIDPRRLATEISEVGLPLDDLIIGLKEKERELKRIGRFFTLMSWRLREYIVLTEYLIKKFYIPLFEGVTMADGLTTVVKKMINVTEGQSSDENRKFVTFANHIDYEKWNNHQRGESVNPVFKVMGEFLGLPNLFTRTHEFFSKSLIYYSGRPDLISWRNLGVGLTVDEEVTSVAWNGQPGGLEGVRQKGWTIVGMLCILREGTNRNTKIQELAQGDNQVIFTEYKLIPNIPLAEQIDTIGINNNNIMKNIGKSVRRLGLIINEDETFTSGGFTIYGKVPIIFGNLINLETKKWNRITCVTNDQIPTICNVLSVIGSTALGSAQGSSSFHKQLDMYSFYSLLMFGIHNQCNVLHSNPLIRNCSDVEFVGKLLYLDKSIGGYTGISPTRFLVRQYPDPITESLSFWKPLLDDNNQDIKMVAQNAWNPRYKLITSNWVRELAENPSGLNIEGGSNIENIFKQEVKVGLIRRCDKIHNDIIRCSLELTRDYEEELMAFLSGIQPCFPRFLAGFSESSVIGISDGVIGLIQNSRTMRNIFKKTFSDKVFRLIVKFEMKAFNFLSSPLQPRVTTIVCSATRADELRCESWGQLILGQTIPHPYEFLEITNHYYIGAHIGVGSPVSIPDETCRIRTTGPIIPYIGSKTSEDTSVLKTWEKELVNPLGRKAFDMMRCIDWFVKRDGNLAQSIKNNLETVTGITGMFDQKTSQRSGCPIHRFSVSRQSSGGFSSVNPNNLRWIYVTAESWEYGNSVNMDFMHQSAMLYAQCSISERITNNSAIDVYNKFKLSCPSCMRIIPELSLESTSVLRVIKGKSISQISKLICPDIKVLTNYSIEENAVHTIDLSDISKLRVSYSCGFNQAFGWGEQSFLEPDLDKNAALFPIGLSRKVYPMSYMDGWRDGLITVACMEVLTYLPSDFKDVPIGMVYGRLFFMCRLLGRTPHALDMFQTEEIRDYLIKNSGWIPPSFPVNRADMGTLITRSLMKMTKCANTLEIWEHIKRDLIIFDELNNTRDRIVLDILLEVFKLLLRDRSSSPAFKKEKLKKLKYTLNDLLRTSVFTEEEEHIVYRPYNIIRTSGSEIRHGLSHVTSHISSSDDDIQFGQELFVYENFEAILTSTSPQVYTHWEQTQFTKDPTVSGLRLVRLATGAHYKIRSIMHTIQDKYGLDNLTNVICIGDGSGGMGSYILRSSQKSNVIFNSLISGREEIINGLEPQGPFAITCLPTSMRERCLNLEDFWSHPSDLSDPCTWAYLFSIFERGVDLLVSDTEAYSEEIMHQVLKNLVRKLKSDSVSTIIFKTHVYFFIKEPLFDNLISMYSNCYYVRSTFASSMTSEIYIILWDPVKTPERRYIAHFTKEQLVKTYVESWSDPATEFDRAYAIYFYKMEVGVDSRLMPDCILELDELLNTIGISYKDRGILSVKLLNHKGMEDLIKTMKSIKKLGMREHWDVVKDKLSEIIPTRTRASNVYSILIGVSLYLSLGLKDFNLHARLINCINAEAILYTELTLTEKNTYKSRTKINVTPKFNYVIKQVGRLVDVSISSSVLRLMRTGLGPKTYPSSEFRENSLDWLIYDKPKLISNKIDAFSDIRDYN